MRVLVAGGYGVFGYRAAERLAAIPGVDVIVAGRTERLAASASESLSRRSAVPVGFASIDATRPEPNRLAQLGITLVINASGPFQDQSDYALARAAISARAHYIDLADARAFVTGISALDEQAKAGNVLVTSGASSVPALSSAVVDALMAERGGQLTSIEHAISPGDSYDPGPATIGSILQGAGRPVPILQDGIGRTVPGWQGLTRLTFPGLGTRLAADCDVPDLALFPTRYPDLSTLRFRAGLEVPLFQIGLWGIAALVRSGVVARPERWAGTLVALKRMLRGFGTDRGGMIVDIVTRRPNTAATRARWSLVARSGHGTYVPTLAAVALARKLARGTIEVRGATPCVGLVTLKEIEAEMTGLDLTTRIETLD